MVSSSGDGRRFYPQILRKTQLFFKWKTQIWIAISVYVHVAIIRKRLGIDRSLYQILQILSITILEKQPILQAFHAPDSIQ